MRQPIQTLSNDLAAFLLSEFFAIPYKHDLDDLSIQSLEMHLGACGYTEFNDTGTLPFKDTDLSWRYLSFIKAPLGIDPRTYLVDPDLDALSKFLNRLNTDPNVNFDWLRLDMDLVTDVERARLERLNLQPTKQEQYDFDHVQDKDRDIYSYSVDDLLNKSATSSEDFNEVEVTGGSDE